MCGAVDRGELAIVPAGDPQKEAHQVRLLLPAGLRDVLVGTQLSSPGGFCPCKGIYSLSSETFVLDIQALSAGSCSDLHSELHTLMSRIALQHLLP